MIIDASQIQLSGQSTHSYEHSRQDRLRIATREAALDITRNVQIQEADATLSTDRVNLSEAARALAARMQQGAGNDFNALERAKQALAPGFDNQSPAAYLRKSVPQATPDTFDVNELSSKQYADMETNIKVLIVEALTGRKIVFFDPAHFREGQSASSGRAAHAMQRGNKTGNPHRSDADWGLAYDYQEVERESQTATFTAAGMVRTADGRKINFETTLEMHRESVSITNFSLRAGNAQLTDPLVINFGGSAADLTEEKFDFDLDSDGSDEKISFTRTGSGFLVYDKNGDGAATNGSELFGPASGNGFAELAAYDQDQNGWIDENDSIYDDLRIWTKTADGADQLDSLQEKNVGAIYLGHSATEFDLMDTAGDLQGRVQSTGIYLTEQGQAKTIQQVDLAAVEPAVSAPPDAESDPHQPDLPNPEPAPQATTSSSETVTVA